MNPAELWFFMIFAMTAVGFLISFLVRQIQPPDGNTAGHAPKESAAPKPSVVSDQNGRVIAMVAPDQEPVAPVAEQPQKPGFNLVKDVALPVAGKVLVALVASHFNHRHHK